MTLYVEGVRSHLSSQMWISHPFPALQRVPLLMTSRLLKMFRQVQEGLLPKFALRMSLKGKYFTFKIRVARELGFVRILQLCFASKAKLKACKFLKPILPRDFGLHILFQQIQAILDSCYFCPHQKLLISLLRSLQRLFESWKQLIVQVGMAWATALMRTSLLPKESNFPFQPASFLHTFSFISAKINFQTYQ